MKRNPPVISLTGPIGSGKTTVANHLIAEHNYVRVRFADGLKDMLKAFGLTDAEVDGDLKEKPCTVLFGKTPRYAMQTLGTEWGRNLIHLDLWVMIWKVAVTKQLALGHSVVCDDCRFLNEALMVETIQGAKIWKLHRPGERPTSHSSEQEFNYITVDRLILNHASIEALQASVNLTLEMAE